MDTSRRLRSILIAIGATALVGCASGQDARAQVPSARPEQLVITLYGSCEREDGGFVDLDRAMFLQNTTIDRQFGRERRRLEIGGQTLYIDAAWNDPPSRRWIEIYSEVQWSETLPDIQLAFVYVEDELALHWRETYQHRPYRQGLLHIDIDGVRKWCEGTGGMGQ